MKVLINNEKEFEMPFEGWTYIVPLKKEVLIEDELAAFLKESFPWLVISFPSQSKNAPEIPAIERTKTKVYIKTEAEKASQNDEDMLVSKSSQIDETLPGDGLPSSGTVDKDGVEWVGEGIEVDGELTKAGNSTKI